MEEWNGRQEEWLADIKKWADMTLADTMGAATDGERCTRRIRAFVRPNGSLPLLQLDKALNSIGW